VAHPNLVRLMGFSSKPRLLIIQELLRGQSVDKQLYIERWRPTPMQIFKVALDIAQGMHYLHTHFDKPIIHRDLKTGNLLLVAPPVGDADEGLQCKITDFGLSRDKNVTREAQQLAQQTEQMTGCGSVLWMGECCRRRFRTPWILTLRCCPQRRRSCSARHTTRTLTSSRTRCAWWS